MIEIDQGSGRLVYNNKAEGHVFDNEVMPQLDGYSRSHGFQDFKSNHRTVT